MTMERTTRLGEIGAVLAEGMPNVLDAATALSESIRPALDPARPERYVLTHKIGSGGQAEVLLGTVRGAEGFQRLVAVKRVRSDLVNPGRSVVALINEARVTARLSHPNVVSVLDVDYDKAGQPFLVMEYVDGVDLKRLIETGPLPHPIAIFIVCGLLSGLGYIHEPRDLGRGRVRPGLVHRDVSPGNVLLSWEGGVKLADFGIAQMLEGTMTAPACAPVGTPGYMSPEQANGQDLDGRSDLYAIGIVLWELLAARRFAVGSEADMTAVFERIPRPSEHRQGIPADLEVVAMRLLAHDRAERYRTAELAVHDLLRCQDAPRDGRADLARFLDERFPRAHRHLPASHASTLGTPSWVCTMTAPPEFHGPAPWPCQKEQRAATQARRVPALAVTSQDSPTEARAGLRSYIERLLGWDGAPVEHALRAVDLAATHQAALVLRGDGDLVQIACGLHRRVLGNERPFVLCDPRRRGTDGRVTVESYKTSMAALGAATGGSVCVHSKRLPRDFAELAAVLRTPGARVQLIICGRPPDRTELVLASIEIPALSTRQHELDRIIDEYAREAESTLQTTSRFTEADRGWVRTHSAVSLSEIEKGVWRLVALRHAGNIARAAELLGMTHSSLGEWFARRRFTRRRGGGGGDTSSLRSHQRRTATR